MEHQTQDTGKPLGRRIAEFRLSQKLTQVAFAKVLGCSPAWLNEVENGRRAARSPRLMKAVHRVVGISPIEWFND